MSGCTRFFANIICREQKINGLWLFCFTVNLATSLFKPKKHHKRKKGVLNFSQIIGAIVDVLHTVWNKWGTTIVCVQKVAVGKTQAVHIKPNTCFFTLVNFIQELAESESNKRNRCFSKLNSGNIFAGTYEHTYGHAHTKKQNSYTKMGDGLFACSGIPRSRTHKNSLQKDYLLLNSVQDANSYIRLCQRYRGCEETKHKSRHRTPPFLVCQGKGGSFRKQVVRELSLLHLRGSSNLFQQYRKHELGFEGYARIELEAAPQSLGTFLAVMHETLSIHSKNSNKELWGLSPEASRMCRQLLHAMKLLHSKQIHHRGLVIGNIAVTRSKLIKIRSLETASNREFGLVSDRILFDASYHWALAPETLLCVAYPQVSMHFSHWPKYAFKHDVYSFGRLLMQITSRRYFKHVRSATTSVERQLHLTKKFPKAAQCKAEVPDDNSAEKHSTVPCAVHANVVRKACARVFLDSVDLFGSAAHIKAYEVPCSHRVVFNSHKTVEECASASRGVACANPIKPSVTLAESARFKSGQSFATRLRKFLGFDKACKKSARSALQFELIALVLRGCIDPDPAQRSLWKDLEDCTYFDSETIGCFEQDANSSSAGIESKNDAMHNYQIARTPTSPCNFAPGSGTRGNQTTRTASGITKYNKPRSLEKGKEEYDILRDARLKEAMEWVEKVLSIYNYSKPYNMQGDPSVGIRCLCNPNWSCNADLRYPRQLECVKTRHSIISHACHLFKQYFGQNSDLWGLVPSAGLDYGIEDKENHDPVALKNQARPDTSLALSKKVLMACTVVAERYVVEHALDRNTPRILVKTFGHNFTLQQLNTIVINVLENHARSLTSCRAVSEVVCDIGIELKHVSKHALSQRELFEIATVSVALQPLNVCWDLGEVETAIVAFEVYFTHRYNKHMNSKAELAFNEFKLSKACQLRDPIGEFICLRLQMLAQQSIEELGLFQKQIATVKMPKVSLILGLFL